MTYFVTAIGVSFQKYDDIFWPQRHKDTEKNTIQVARSTRRRVAAGEALPTANERPLDRGSVVRLRSARLTARPAVQAARVERLRVSVSPWLVQLNTS